MLEQREQITHASPTSARGTLCLSHFLGGQEARCLLVLLLVRLRVRVAQRLLLLFLILLLLISPILPFIFSFILLIHAKAFSIFPILL